MAVLDGRTAVVTGAGRGIGRAVALHVAGLGADVVVNDADVTTGGDAASEGSADRVVAEIGDAGGTAIAHYASVADEAGAHSIIDAATGAFGSVDILVNCAGILRDRILHRMSVEDWDAVLNVHLRGTFLMCRAALPGMREREHGRIINFVSTSGLIGNIGQANYGAAKLGIVSLTRTVALENSQKMVTANAVSPWAWTRMTQSIPGSDEDRNEARIARLRSLDASDVAPLVAYLSSDAASQVSGQVFGVRGRELMLFSQPRPVRVAYRSDGWTTETVGDIVDGLFRSEFTPLETSSDVFSYPPPQND